MPLSCKIQVQEVFGRDKDKEQLMNKIPSTLHILEVSHELSISCDDLLLRGFKDQLENAATGFNPFAPLLRILHAQDGRASTADCVLNSANDSRDKAMVAMGFLLSEGHGYFGGEGSEEVEILRSKLKELAKRKWRNYGDEFMERILGPWSDRPLVIRSTDDLNTVLDFVRGENATDKVEVKKQ